MALIPDLAAVGFGLASAASWGVGDFSGGLATRRTNVFGVIVVAHAVGFVMVIALALLWAEPFPPIGDLAWACLAGLTGAIGIVAFYQALATGQMGIAAPVAAVFTAAIPVVVAAFTQGIPAPIKLIGFALALVGIWLLSRPQHASGRPVGLGLAIVAGLGFGGFLVLINHAGTTAVFWPLAAARLASTIAMTIVALTSQPGWQPQRRQIPLITFSGILDLGGNAFFVLAGQSGGLAVAAVLSSLYPATTVLLAWLLLKERVTRMQAIGILAALIAVPLIAAK